MIQQNRWTLCWAVVLGCFASVAEAQAPLPRPKFGTWNPPAATSTTGHYGILGEVARPGVYSAEGREVTLQELVQNAGGLTAMAGPAVRLVRQQRVAQGKFFDPNGRDVLQSGDIVLIENPRPRSSDAARVVRIAMIGVASRPIIVPLHPETANLDKIMLALGQSRDLARALQFVMPSRQPTPNSITAPLPSGTVLILDPRLLVASQLPSFDDSASMAIPMASAAASLPPTAAPFVDPSLNIPPSTAVITPQIPDQIADNRLPTIPLGRNGGGIDVTPLPFTNGDKRPQVNDTSLPVPGSRLNPAPIEVPQPVVTKPKATVPLLNEKAEIIPDLDDLGIDEEEPSATAVSTPAGLSPWYLLGIVGTVASLVGVAVLTRTGAKPRAKSTFDNDVVPASIRKRSAMPTAGPPRPHHRFDMPEPMPAAPTPTTLAKAAPLVEKTPIAESVPTQELHDLHEILAMRGPIETEAVVLPHGMKLRHAALKPTPIYRADEPAMLPGAPHERPLAPTTPQRSLDTIVREKVPAPHFLATPAPSVKPPLPAEELVGGTAIERALHQLQQGKLS